MSSARREKVVAVVNPAARGDPGPVIEQLRSRAPANVELEVIRSAKPGSTTALVREVMVNAATVIAVGGDGTVGAAATALSGTDIRLAIVPIGTTNLIARDLGIPTRATSAIELVFTSPRIRSLDVAVRGDEGFVHMAGAGLAGHMFSLTDPFLKRRFGWFAYVDAAIRSLAIGRARVRIVADNQILEARSQMVLVANGSSIAPGLPVYPGVESDDGWLDVLLFTPAGALAIALTAIGLLTRRLARSPYVTHVRAHRQVEVTSDPVVAVQMDGDVAATTPATFTLKPASVRVIVPAGDTPRATGSTRS